jgi:hypothetical protein
LQDEIDGFPPQVFRAFALGDRLQDDDRHAFGAGALSGLRRRRDSQFVAEPVAAERQGLHQTGEVKAHAGLGAVGHFGGAVVQGRAGPVSH